MEINKLKAAVCNADKITESWQTTPSSTQKIIEICNDLSYSIYQTTQKDLKDYCWEHLDFWGNLGLWIGTFFGSDSCFLELLRKSTNCFETQYPQKPKQQSYILTGTEEAHLRKAAQQRGSAWRGHQHQTSIAITAGRRTETALTQQHQPRTRPPVVKSKQSPSNPTEPTNEILTPEEARIANARRIAQIFGVAHGQVFTGRG